VHARPRGRAHAPARPRAHAPAATPAVSAALVIAAALVLALRLNPGFDPYGWLVWGRQTLHGALDPFGAPSWKPFAWLLSTVVALAGGAAPALWVIVSAAGGLTALWLAYRLADRLAGAVAGVLALAAILICRDWLTFLLNGDLEPFSAALALGAVDRHLAGQRRFALGLLAVAALIRPECFLVLGAYGLWLWVGDRRARWLELTWLLALLALWFLPPYLALGHGFNSSDPAFHVGNATHNPLKVVSRGATIVIWPVATCALAGLALGSWHGGSERRLTAALAAIAAGWTVGTAAMAAVGFPGLQRFMLPAAAAGCVLAGAGAVWAAQLLWTWRRALAAVAISAGAAITVYYGAMRVADAVSSVSNLRSLSALHRSLSRAISDAGGASAVLRCGHPTAKLADESAIAWDLNVPVGDVGLLPALDVRSRHPQVLIASGSLLRLGRGGRLLGASGPWRVIAVHARPGCVSAAARSA